MRPLVLLAALVAGAPTPPVRATSLPRTAVVGTAWRVVLRAPARPAVVATGPATVRVKVTGREGVYRARLSFPRAGTWRIRAPLHGRTTQLGTIAVDAAR